MPQRMRSSPRPSRPTRRASGAADLFEGRFFEVLIIFVLALIVLGPEKLPRVVSELGRWVGRARAMARQFREQLEEEVQLEAARKAQPMSPQASAPGAAAPTAPTPAPPPAETPPYDKYAHHAQPLSPPAAELLAPPPAQPPPSETFAHHAQPGAAGDPDTTVRTAAGASADEQRT